MRFKLCVTFTATFYFCKQSPPGIGGFYKNLEGVKKCNRKISQLTLLVNRTC